MIHYEHVTEKRREEIYLEPRQSKIPVLPDAVVPSEAGQRRLRQLHQRPDPTPDPPDRRPQEPFLGAGGAEGVSRDHARHGAWHGGQGRQRRGAPVPLAEVDVVACSDQLARGPDLWRR